MTNNLIQQNMYSKVDKIQFIIDGRNFIMDSEMKSTGIKTTYSNKDNSSILLNNEQYNLQYNLHNSQNIFNLCENYNELIYPYFLTTFIVLFSGASITISQFQINQTIHNQQDSLKWTHEFNHKLQTFQLIGIIVGLLLSILNDQIGRRYGITIAQLLLGISGISMCSTEMQTVFLVSFITQSICIGQAFLGTIVQAYEITYNRLSITLTYLLSISLSLCLYLISLHIFGQQQSQIQVSIISITNALMIFYSNESIRYLHSSNNNSKLCELLSSQLNNNMPIIDDQSLVQMDVENSQVQIDLDTYKNTALATIPSDLSLQTEPIFTFEGYNPFNFVQQHFNRLMNKSPHSENLQNLMKFGTFQPIAYLLVFPLIPDMQNENNLISRDGFNFVSMNSMIISLNAIVVIQVVFLPFTSNSDSRKVHKVEMAWWLAIVQVSNQFLSMLLIAMPWVLSRLNLVESADVLLPLIVGAEVTFQNLTQTFFQAMLQDNTFSRYRAHDLAIFQFLQLKALKILHFIVFFFQSNYPQIVFGLLMAVAAPILYFSYTLYKSYKPVNFENR